MAATSVGRPPGDVFLGSLLESLVAWRDTSSGLAGTAGPSPLDCVWCLKLLMTELLIAIKLTVGVCCSQQAPCQPRLQISYATHTHLMIIIQQPLTVFVCLCGCFKKAHRYVAVTTQDDIIILSELRFHHGTTWNEPSKRDGSSSWPPRDPTKVSSLAPNLRVPSGGPHTLAAAANQRHGNRLLVIDHWSQSRGLRSHWGPVGEKFRLKQRLMEWLVAIPSCSCRFIKLVGYDPACWWCLGGR